MISQNTISTVFETARVEEVIQDFVQLKKSGSNMKGLSPFSDERTPSFMVSPAKQIWKDFSTGKGGNVVSFLMEHEHYNYPESIRYLAKKYNIEIEETVQSDEHKKQANERESLYLVNEYAVDYFKRILHTTKLGKAIGLSYFEERGFTKETIEKFDLGYNPDTWDAFTTEAIKKGYQLEYLEQTGLTIVKEEKQFDRFKGRVLFPIKSMSGRILGFGGRILDSTKKAAKYLNSPESPVYHKSKVLYGLFEAKQAIAKEDRCYLVEGYTDVIQFQQTGIENVVASSGTALTPEQIRLIQRLTKNITVLFDGDAAGMRAALRGVDLILEQDMNVRVCTFPEGQDPDSFARSNTLVAVQNYLNENSKDFIRFKASLLATDSKDDPIKKADLIRDMVGSIAKIPDTIKREVYIQECARIMDISEEVLFSTLAQQLSNEERESKKREIKQQKTLEVVKEEVVVLPKVNEQFELEKKIIEILLLYGINETEFEDMILKENEDGELVAEPDTYSSKVFEKVYLDLQEDEIEFTNQSFKEIYRLLIAHLSQKQELQIDTFINEIAPEIAQEITTILMDEEKHLLHDWERNEIYVKQKSTTVGQFVNDTILNLRRYLINTKINELSEAIRKPKEERTESTTEILSDIMEYSKLKMLVSQKLNRVV